MSPLHLKVIYGQDPLSLTLPASPDITLQRHDPVNVEAGKRPIKILFVCLANLCRSPIAKVIAKTFYGGTIEAESAGIAPAKKPVFPETVFILKKFYGVDISGHKSRHVLEFPVADFDYIIAMDSSIFIRLSEIKAIRKDKLYGWDVKDPSGLGIEAFEWTALQIEDNLDRFFRKHRIRTKNKKI